MRILLDTNIFIPLEDSLIEIGEKLAELNRLASGKHELLLHPATIEDIKRDKDDNRKKRSLARVKKYHVLEYPPEFKDGEELSLLGTSKKDNDRIDNIILLALHKNCVNWLITQDVGLHKKAKTIGQEERVFTVDQAITSLLRYESKELKLYQNIIDVPCHALDLKNIFFNSLRRSYEFDNWYIEKCARTGRRVWVAGSIENIDALCIYNEENNPIITQDNKGLTGKVLKLCTFKVVRLGYKIGELLLKQAFNYASDNNIDYIYVTIEPDKHLLLENLFLDFGFYSFGIDTKGRDYVFIKEFPKNFPTSDLPPLDYAIKYFPLTKIESNSAYLIPIKPVYHEILFPELKSQKDLFTNGDSSAGNAIKQAYICESNSNSIKPGDILFFYRTQDEMAVTTYGIVDQFHIESDPEKIFQWVSKRTVYSLEEIQNMANKKVKIILFRLVGHLDNFINFDRLKELKIVNGNIQSITKISHQKIKNIINEAKLSNCILPNKTNLLQ